MKWLKWKTSMPTPFMEDYIAQKCDDIYFFIDWSCVDQAKTTNPAFMMQFFTALHSNTHRVQKSYIQGSPKHLAVGIRESVLFPCGR